LNSSTNEIAAACKESFSSATGTAFAELYNLYRNTATLNVQVEILKEMMLTIPQIRDNKAFRQQVEEEFDLRENIGYDPENA